MELLLNARLSSFSFDVNGESSGTCLAWKRRRHRLVAMFSTLFVQHMSTVPPIEKKVLHFVLCMWLYLACLESIGKSPSLVGGHVAATLVVLVAAPVSTARCNAKSFVKRGERAC